MKLRSIVGQDSDVPKPENKAVFDRTYAEYSAYVEKGDAVDDQIAKLKRAEHEEGVKYTE